MDAATFRSQLIAYMDVFQSALSTDDNDWVVKGFIDIYRNIYTVSIDTKVISKIIELMLFPIIARFASEHHYQIIPSEHQNHYPDISFIAPDKSKIALDFKSTYRANPTTVSGLTLGTFTGYFRGRNASKNITFPYQDYAAHLVLGVIYTRSDAIVDEQRVYQLDELLNIPSVIRDFTFLLQEKWRIASDKPGSGNTRNIGSTRNIDALLNGQGAFAEHGEAVFDDYWMNYLTPDMARAIESVVPYRSLEEYWQWRNR